MHRILFVDVDPFFRRIVSDLLKSERYCFDTAESSESALETLRRDSVDLVITDVGTPAHEALELLRDVRDGHPAVMTIALVDYADTGIVDAAEGIGVHRILPKPFSITRLRQTVDVLLSATESR